MTVRQRCSTIICVLLVIGIPPCAPAQTPQDCQLTINHVAEPYVRLVLKIGLYKDDYIDAYFGPSEWKPSPANDSLKRFPFEECENEVTRLLDTMAEIGNKELTPSQRKRWRSLDDHIRSLRDMIEILNGKKMAFDEESMAIYRVKAPSYDSLHYDSLLSGLDSLLPGKGDMQPRFVEFRKQFLVPHDKLDTLMRTAIAYCRELSQQHIKLPSSEQFVIELLPRQPWSAYNWYKGNLTSLIQIDSSDDFGIEDVISLAAHEGYPGHHVQNLMEDDCLYRDSGWVEHSVQPLFSPRSLFFEGEADYSMRLLFPKHRWLEFMKNTLCPLAGINTAKIELYYDILNARKALRYAGIDVARDYLESRKSREAAIAWGMHYRLMTWREAEDMIDFYDRYRSYTITYSVGEDLVRDYIEANGGTENNPLRQWELFTSLLTSPVSATDLQPTAKVH